MVSGHNRYWRGREFSGTDDRQSGSWTLQPSVKCIEEANRDGRHAITAAGSPGASAR